MNKKRGSIMSILITAIFLFVMHGIAIAQTDSEFSSPTDNTVKSRAESSENMNFLGNWPFSSPRAVTHDANRNLVFCSAGGGVLIYDVSDSYNPIKISDHIRCIGLVMDIAFDNQTHMLYIADDLGGLEIWDISSATNPVKAGVYENNNRISCVALQGSYAYIGTTCNGAAIIDISDPSNPTLAGTLDLPSSLWTGAVDVEGDYMYISRNKDHGSVDEPKIAIVDITDPYNPVVVNTVANINIIDFVVKQSMIYATEEGTEKFTVIDVSDPFNPTISGSCTITNNPRCVQVVGNYAYVADGSNITVINVSAAQPYVVLTTNDSGFLWGLTTLNGFLYAADQINGLRVYNANKPGDPYMINTLPIPSYCTKVIVKDNYTFLGYNNLNSGIYIFDNADEANQQLVSTYIVPDQVIHTFSIGGSYLYILVGNGVRIVDISDINNPQEVAACVMPCGTGVSSMSMTNNYLYVVHHGNTVTKALTIIDVSEPHNPIVYPEYEVSCKQIMSSSGKYVYMVVNAGGYSLLSPDLCIVDVSDPSNPMEVSSLQLRNEAQGIYVYDSHVYVTYYGDVGMSIINVQQASHPHEVGYYGTYAKKSIKVLDSYAYLGAYSPRLGREIVEIVDISNPAVPRNVGYHTTPFAVKDIDLAGVVKRPTIYAVIPSCGLQIYKSTVILPKDDLIGSWQGAGVWYRNSDNSQWHRFIAEDASLLASGDIDGDGIDDLVGVWFDPGQIWVRKSTDQSWHMVYNSANSGAILSISCGDMNGDGIDEVIGSYEGVGVWYWNPVDGLWTRLHNEHARMVTSGDMDNDGIDELIGSWTNYPGVWVRWGNTATWEKISATVPMVLACGDMDGNGYDNIVIGLPGFVYFIDHIAVMSVALTDQDIDQIAVGDLDGDGIDELLYTIVDPIPKRTDDDGVWVKYSSSGETEKLHANDPICITTGEVVPSPVK